MLLYAVPNTQVMAMPIGTESTRVSLNLMSAPTASTPSASAPTPPPVTQKSSVTQPVEQKTDIKKLVKKTQSEAKPTSKPVHHPEPKAKQKTEPKTQPEFKTSRKVTAPQPDKRQSEAAPNTAATNSQDTHITETKASPSASAAGVNSPALVNQPTFATKPSPVSYPRIARRRGLEGQVTVEVWIDEKGRQIKQMLVQSSGAQVLDEAALDTIKRWRFSSHIVDGHAIAHRVHIPVRFKLD